MYDNDSKNGEFNNVIATQLRVSANGLCSIDQMCKLLFLEWPDIPCSTYDKACEMVALIAGYANSEELYAAVENRKSISNGITTSNIEEQEKARIILQRIRFVTGADSSKAKRLYTYFEEYLPCIEKIRSSQESLLSAEAYNSLILSEAEKLYFRVRDDALLSLVHLAFENNGPIRSLVGAIGLSIYQLDDLVDYFDLHRSWAFENHIDIEKLYRGFDIIQDEIMSLRSKLECWQASVANNEGALHFYSIAEFILDNGIKVKEEQYMQLRRVVKASVKKYRRCLQ